MRKNFIYQNTHNFGAKNYRFLTKNCRLEEQRALWGRQTHKKGKEEKTTKARQVNKQFRLIMFRKKKTKNLFVYKTLIGVKSKIKKFIKFVF